MIDQLHILQTEVLVNGRRPREGAIELIRFFHEQDIPYLILSEQSGRNRSQLADFFENCGFPRIFDHRFYTSAMAAVDWLMAYEPERRTVDYLGGNAIRSAIEISGLNLSRNEAQALFLGMDRNLTYDDYADALQPLLNGALLLSTDSRRRMRLEGREIIGNGSLTKMFEYAAGTKAADFGHGSILMLRMALRYLKLYPEDVLMVGNSFEKDIQPAVELGMPSVYVTQGRSIVNLDISEDCHPDFIVEDLHGLTR
jgi:4-nitrophenyl phosphatase